MRSDDPVDVARLPGQMERTGAVVMNRRLFDVVDGPNGWVTTEASAPRRRGRPVTGRS